MKNMSKELLDRINELATPVKIMHVCGSHEHTIMENGIRSLLPEEVEIVAGPGCPVCVVPSREIDECLELVEKGVTITTFGDMLRVPGSNGSLAEAKAEGGDVRIVYGINIEASNIYYHHVEDFSVLDIVKKANPNMEIVGGILKEEALKVIEHYNDIIKKEDEKFIDIAIDLSSKAKFPYGAIVVRKGNIIGKSNDSVPVSDTIYTHAELIAIESAVLNIKESISRGNLHECTLYTSCEPCMMCQEAILAEGISRVVYAATIEDSSKFFCEEFPVSLESIVKRSNSHIIIVPELHREKAIEVLKNFSN